jgi:hypothetical protein
MIIGLWGRLEQTMIQIFNPDAPEGAEWKNYMDTPRRMESFFDKCLQNPNYKSINANYLNIDILCMYIR